MNLKYCTECAAPLARIDATDYVCTNGHKYHNNPHASVSLALLNEDNELLLVERGIEPRKGMFALPGGFLNYDENAYQAAKREAKEELGIDLDEQDLTPIDCALHYYLENDSAAGVTMLCRKWQGTISTADDAAAYVWKPITFLKTDEIAWPYPYLYNRLESLVHHDI